MKAGDLNGAINDMVGVMNADPKYHLQGLPVLAQIYKIRGDAPGAIEAELQRARDDEKVSSAGFGAALSGQALRDENGSRHRPGRENQNWRCWPTAPGIVRARATRSTSTRCATRGSTKTNTAFKRPRTSWTKSRSRARAACPTPRRQSHPTSPVFTRAEYSVTSMPLCRDMAFRTHPKRAGLAPNGIELKKL